jgi:hypothetical protein
MADAELAVVATTAFAPTRPIKKPESFLFFKSIFMRTQIRDNELEKALIPFIRHRWVTD